MQKALQQFKNNLKYVHELQALYTFLTIKNKLPANSVADILRAEWVYSVSALDKLVHELVRIGMIQAFLNIKPKTKKFLTFPIPVETHHNIVNATTIPPPEYWFEKEIIQRHKTLSFQEPIKIADALSLIWNEDHKWQKIATALTISEEDVKTKLITIASRRNQIVHEADLDILSGQRNNIEEADVAMVITFIENLGDSIYNNVK